MAHPAPRRTIGTWEILDMIGHGSFAVVWKARHVANGALAAVKEILVDRLNKKLHESLESEIAVLQKLKHPNIVGLLDLYKEPGKIFLVLEYCGGGDLAQHLRTRGPLSEASCRYLLRHLAEGLKVLRQHNVIHRDLKPQNLLLSDSGPSPTLKIADFGFARSLQPAGLAETLCGSPLYMAPEVLQLHRYDAKADLWSVGTIVFELLTGKPPFNGGNHLQLIQNIERGDAVLPEHLARSLSPGCRQLLHQLLRRNPIERISFDELFAHPFLAGDAASAAVHQLPTASSGSSGGSNSSTSPFAAAATLGDGSPPRSAAIAAHGQTALPLQRRHTPTSQGAVRFVQPIRCASPVHPALQIPSSSSSSAAATAAAGAPNSPFASPAAQQQPQGGALGGSGSGHGAAGGGQNTNQNAPRDETRSSEAQQSGGGLGASTVPSSQTPIHVRELKRSPTPRIIAAAAAVETALALQTGASVQAPTAAANAVNAPSERAPTSPSAGLGSSSMEVTTAAGAGSSGDPLTESSDSDYVVISSPSAGRPSLPLVPRTPHPAMVGARSSGSRDNSAGGAPLSPPLPKLPTLPSTLPPVTAAAPTAVAAVPPPWQQLLSPIAAAAAPAAPAAAAQPLRVTSAAPTTAATPTETTDVTSEPAQLLPRVVAALLDHARARCKVLLDQEEEATQLGFAGLMGLAAASHMGPTGGGGGVESVAGSATSTFLGAQLADEAAVAVGTLLAACRLLVAALAGARGGSDGGRGGDSDPTQQEWVASGKVAGAGLGQELLQTAAVVTGATMALSALETQARNVLSDVDEQLQGTVARLLRDGAGEGPLSASATPPSHSPTAFSPSQQPLLVPGALDALLATAIHHSRAAAGEELLGNAAGAAEQYGRAGDVLAFLLAAPPPPSSPYPRTAADQEPAKAGGGGAGESLQEKLLEAVRPPLTPADRQRLTKYQNAVRLRQAAVRAAATAGGLHSLARLPHHAAYLATQPLAHSTHQPSANSYQQPLPEDVLLMHQLLPQHLTAASARRSSAANSTGLKAHASTRPSPSAALAGPAGTAAAGTATAEVGSYGYGGARGYGAMVY